MNIGIESLSHLNLQGLEVSIALLFDVITQGTEIA
jgi:hypothetical protein